MVKKSICHCKRYKRWEFYPWVGEYPGVGNGNPFNILACKIPLSKKYGHNLKVELFYLVGMFRTLRRQQLSNSEKAAPRRQEEKSGYIEFCNRGSRQSENQRSGIKLKNVAFYVWEDASFLDSLNSFLSYAPQNSPSQASTVGEL